MKAIDVLREALPAADVEATLDHYSKTFKLQEPDVELSDARISSDYYTLATDFYLQGWGKLFHFGVRRKGETLLHSQLRYEQYLVDRLKLKAGETCLDLGCGVAGPMMNIAKSSKATVCGINNCTYQVQKGREFITAEGLDNTCSVMECDWMNIPLPDKSFDKAYAIEATCHAAENRHLLFTEIHRLLKPGSFFGGYEWVLTGNYNPADPEHREIKKKIEIGDGISQLTYSSEVKNALIKAGFEVIDFRDRALECDRETPWYLPLKGEGLSLTKLRLSPIGRVVMRNFIGLLETIRLMPKGARGVHRMLEMAADGLVAGGEKQIFTPMLFFLARKL